MRPDRDAVLMAHAKIAAMRGTCSRLQVGAVASRDGRVLLTGYNGSPAGMPHCRHQSSFAGGPCVEAVHAEENIIAYAARHGIALEGAELHTTDSPCYLCARLIINSGITRVVYDRAYRLTDGLNLLFEAGVQIKQFAGEILVA